MVDARTRAGRRRFPLIPAQAGIQKESVDVAVNQLGRRFRVDERMEQPIRSYRMFAQIV
jgi:hypothetical protein